MTTGSGNPFNNGIVSDAWSPPVVDVPSISRDVLDLCLASLVDVQQHRKRRAILIHGLPGSGKTHLLSRLRSTVMDDAVGAAPFFCYVRLATTPNMMGRHLRSCLVRDLVRKDADGITHLERVLLESLAKETGRPHDRARAGEQLSHLRTAPACWDEMREAFGEICTRLDLDYPLARACRLYLLRQHRPEVVHWLKCGELPDAMREDLGFDAAAGSGAGDPERAATDIAHQLCRLVVDTRPVVLCFDQVESLQVSPDDRTGFFAFGRLAADLVDQVESMLLITCLQSGLWPQVRQAVAQADYDRLAQHERVLGPLSAEQAGALIRARLDSSAALRDDPRRVHDPLWPLGQDGLRHFLLDGDRTPRRLIAMCREAFPHAGGQPADVNALLTDLFERRRCDALGPIEDTAATFVHGLALVIAARKRIPVATPSNRLDVDLVISLPGRQVTVSMCNHEGNMLTAQLKRLVRLPLGGHEERILVRDMRLPIPHTSLRAWEYWEAMVANRERTEAGISRVRTLCPSPEALAALEAVRWVMSDARAGELESRGRTIQPHTVEEWIRGHLRDEHLDRLIAEIEHGPARKAAVDDTVRTPLRDAVLEHLQRRHLMRIGELAAATGSGEEEIRRLVTAGEPVFGILGDPPVLVFERFAAVAVPLAGHAA